MIGEDRIEILEALLQGQEVPDSPLKDWATNKIKGAKNKTEVLNSLTKSELLDIAFYLRIAIKNSDSKKVLITKINLGINLGEHCFDLIEVEDRRTSIKEVFRRDALPPKNWQHPQVSDWLFKANQEEWYGFAVEAATKQVATLEQLDEAMLKARKKGLSAKGEREEEIARQNAEYKAASKRRQYRKKLSLLLFNIGFRFETDIENNTGDPWAMRDYHEEGGNPSDYGLTKTRVLTYRGQSFASLKEAAKFALENNLFSELTTEKRRLAEQLANLI